MFHVLCRFHQQNFALWQLPHGAQRLWVPGMADHHHLQALGRVAFGLYVHLGHQRAGGVDIDHLPFRGSRRHRLGHTMRREYHRAVIGAVVQVLDEHRALGAQPIHHEPVVHDFMAHIDRRAPFLQRHLDDLDRPVDPGAESARGGQV